MTERSDRSASVWHEGELRLQRSVGVEEEMEEFGKRFIRNHLIDRDERFFCELPFVVLGTVDAGGDVWATIRTGLPGFVSARDPRHLQPCISADASDPAGAGMQAGSAMAVLGIEFATRLRNRVNGRIEQIDQSCLVLSVEQAYSNCPQHIQFRDAYAANEPDPVLVIESQNLAQWDGMARDMIQRADTFFVATYSESGNGERSVDISHRGGQPGFASIGGDGAITVPDFAGNHFFNTLGNIDATGKAGLVFVDFADGDLLQVSGGAEVLLDAPETATFDGAERIWRVRHHRIVRRRLAQSIR